MLDRLQINIEYSNTEDRLLLRICGMESQGECVEYRFWLTRRFVSIFIQAIDKLISDCLAADMQVSPDALEAMKKFQQEAALAKADFSTPYGAFSEDCTLIGEAPFLAATLKIQKKSKDRFVLSLLTVDNEGINLAADLDIIHTLRKMIVASVDNAGWNQPVSGEAGKELKAAESSLRMS
ncbi:MAG: hypothetical protein JRF02_01455 [Deltaproteobacteria bacterium]|jgi:hypothetical protein|nr:hypothetical protein [Deltaproteobacteria bacterium]